MTGKKIIGLQWLRAIAALLVLIAHNHDVMYQYNMQIYDGWIGGIGVDIFFIISGYVMFSLMAGKPRGLTTAYDFAARRIGRIIPIYWLMIAAVIFAWSMTGADMFSDLNDRSGIRRIVLNLFFIDKKPIVTVGWTLSYEMLFYALSTIALAFFRHGYTRLVFIAAVLFLCFIFRTVFNHPGFIPGKPVALEFVAGGLIWALLSRKAVKISPLVGVVTAMAGCVGIAMLYGNHALNHGDMGWFASATLIVLGVLIAEPYFASLRWQRPADLGDASYFLYLIHIYVVILVNYLVFGVVGAHSSIAAMAVTFTCIVVASEIALYGYWYLERPLTRAVTRILVALPYGRSSANGEVNKEFRFTRRPAE
ncbi:exopolysaccharide production protein ExoZ [Sphingomonas sp. SORGH_AS 950]|uniref:acyltransferase family protein n=1 Tax=Sphingomonas sp. SORGH_AS_0950 TaxID=3041792 RepID=UPI002784F625|nr:acyltransferase [Sphingomonas sp. SORGH_AS_0950]MDQ1159444.1 exopolysaccharide production protein ExoZ [Sphingomonas sp. SORGH_AS_0950]